MKHRMNWAAGLLLLLMLASAAAVPVWGLLQQPNTILVRARMPEAGGWMPGSLQAQVGQPLQLRLTSDDVTHSFAIGHRDMEPVDVIPGEISEVTLTFDRPGKYTYHCTRWCGPNHWRMRGVIEVSGPQSDLVLQNPPLYVTEGIDIDQPHPAAVTPAERPQSARGARILEDLAPGDIAAAYRDPKAARISSPADTWQALRNEPSLQGLDDQEIWDIAAALFQAQVSPEALEEGRSLYAQNCAACHGENGAGDGVMARSFTPSMGGPGPTDFTAAASMLGASPAILQGKIVRGGMGTGMPYWGPVLTEEQTWALVAYIQSFQYELENKP